MRFYNLGVAEVQGPNPMPGKNAPGGVCRRLLLGLLLALLLAALAPRVSGAPRTAPQAGDLPQRATTFRGRAGAIGAPRPDGTLQGQQRWMDAPAPYVPEFLTAPRALTAAQIAASHVSTDKNYPTWADRRAGITGSALSTPLPGTESVPVRARGRATRARDAGDLLIRFVPVDPTPYGLAVRMVAEPALARSAAAIWMTGNWFAARSTDEGANWSFVDPSADFPEFTSDQDVVYDPQRHAFLWIRQGNLLPGLYENSDNLSVSTDDGQSWCTYTLRPTALDASWTNFDFDYPHLGLTNDFLYVSSTFLTWGDGYATPRMVLLRLPLNGLSQCAQFSYTFWTADDGWDWTPVETGATTAMYLGDTQDPGGDGRPGTFRLFTQREMNTDLTYVDRAVPPWTFTDRNGLCPVPGGGNPCARADERITSGWVRHVNGAAEIGFLWNVREGGPFPYPYVEAVTFDEATERVTGRPLLWSSRCAWQYAAAAPTARGELGIAAFYFCSGEPPAHAVGLRDGPLWPMTGWPMAYTRVGGTETATTIWGDYIRVRPEGAGLIATGYTLEPDGAKPFYVFFSRPGHRTPSRIRGTDRR